MMEINESPIAAQLADAKELNRRRWTRVPLHDGQRRRLIPILPTKEPTMKLNDRQIEVLTAIEDGTKYEMSAWPITDINQSIIEVIKGYIAVGCLAAWDLIEVEDDDDGERVWITLTSEGRSALRNNRRDGR